MAERNVREPEQPVNYAMLSLFQYMASILVILVHCQRLFENEVLHFTQKSMFGRMAVPFFLISSAFMLKSSLAKKQDMKLYIKRILKQYLLWSGIYVPYALAYFWTLPVQKHYAPLALLAGLLYIGLCYQLFKQFSYPELASVFVSYLCFTFASAVKFFPSSVSAKN